MKKTNIAPKAKNDHPRPKVITGTGVSSHGDDVKSAKTEKTVKAEKTAKTEQTGKPQKTEKLAKTVKIENTAKSQKTEKNAKNAKTEKTVKTANAPTPEKVAKTSVDNSKSTTKTKGRSTKKPNATADSDYGIMETSYLKSRPVQATITGEKSTNPTNSEYAFTSGKERKVTPTGDGGTSQGYGTQLQPWATNQTPSTSTKKAERDVKRDRLIRTLRWFAYT